MMSKVVNPQDIYALVVGIERYDWAKLEGLKGCANDAIRFAKWLSDQGVPPNNISLCLSSLDAESDLELPPAISRQVANRSTVFDRLTALTSTQGVTFFLFWAGHGVIKNSTYRLFFADATERNPLNMNLNAELDALKTTAYDGFPQMFCFVDACAIPIEEIEQDVDLPDNILIPKKIYYKTGWEQYIAFAAREGESAKIDRIQRTGYFSRELMEELKGRTLPLNLEELSTALMERFERLRQEDGKFTQTPNYYWRVGKNGQQRTLDYRLVPAINLPRKSSSNPRYKRLKQEYDDSQEQYAEQNAKVRELRRVLLHQAVGSYRYQLQNDLEQEKRKLNVIETGIDALEKELETYEQEA